MKRLATAIILVLTLSGLFAVPTTVSAQAIYRWDARVYTPYSYGPTYYYSQARGLYANPYTHNPVPFYTYRYYVAPNYSYPTNYYWRPSYYYPYSSYYIPRYYVTPSSVYVPY